jgi:protein-L-isoaspartate(D-aspartate) O-methyltransferase
MVIPAGLPDGQQLILVEKDARGSVSTKEIFAVLFSLLDDSEPD